jgi:hypothetical protein
MTITASVQLEHRITGRESQGACRQDIKMIKLRMIRLAMDSERFKQMRPEI